MNLRPVLTLGAIGSLIAAGSVAPAYAVNSQNVEDQATVEATDESVVETDAPVVDAPGEADSVPAEVLDEEPQDEGEQEVQDP